MIWKKTKKKARAWLGKNTNIFYRLNSAGNISQADRGDCRWQGPSNARTHGMLLTMWGPRILVIDSGSFCQTLIAKLNFGFFVFSSGNDVPSDKIYCQFNWIGFAPHCSLNLYVPSPGVERPKSNRLKPCDKANCSAVQ